jgi:phosphohistidine phosphatase SixA
VRSTGSFPSVVVVVRPALIAAALLWTLAPAVSHAQQAVILVRHAEKLDASDDSPLSREGEERATRLANMLENAGVSAVYATEFRRTVQTVEPLAAARGLKVEVVHSNESQAQVDALRRDHPSGVVVLAGHSGSVPRLLKLLGHPQEVRISDDEYTNLFIVVPVAAGPPTVVRLRY